MHSSSLPGQSTEKYGSKKIRFEWHFMGCCEREAGVGFKLTFIQNSTASFQGAHRLEEDHDLLFTQVRSSSQNSGSSILPNIHQFSVSPWPITSSWYRRKVTLSLQKVWLIYSHLHFHVYTLPWAMKWEYISTSLVPSNPCPMVSPPLAVQGSLWV